MNVLIALSEEEHEHHQKVMQWFLASGHRGWGVCPFTEAGFLRLMSNPRVGGHTLEESVAVLTAMASVRGYQFWPIANGWAELTTPFAARLFGHLQITDAYLLGLAIREGGVLVTFDEAIKYLAGNEHGQSVLLLASSTG